MHNENRPEFLERLLSKLHKERLNRFSKKPPEDQQAELDKALQKALADDKRFEEKQRSSGRFIA